MAIPITTQFNTSDYHFNPYVTTAETFVGDTWTSGLKTPEAHTDSSHEFVAAEALQKLYNITERLRLEQSRNIIIETPIGGVSYATLSRITFASIGAVILLAAYAWRHFHIMGRRRCLKIVEHLTKVLIQERTERGDSQSASSLTAITSIPTKIYPETNDLVKSNPNQSQNV